tara:strand:- start:1708 stop:1917 length:210 start_codon:yes stop_codon:yes gene_type:complete
MVVSLYIIIFYKIVLKKHLCDADVVHHLAGITDVAYTKTEINFDLNKNNFENSKFHKLTKLIKDIFYVL